MRISGGSTLNDAVGRRQPLRWARSGQHPRPLVGELWSLGRGTLRVLDLDRAQRPAGSSYYEVCCLLRGTDEWLVADRSYRVSPGDVFTAAFQRPIARL